MEAQPGASQRDAATCGLHPLVPGRRSLGEWARAALPSGAELPDEAWERHHALVLRVLVALSIGVVVYAAARGYGAAHVVGHAAPLALLTLAAHLTALTRGWRAAAAAMGLMTASALVVHASHGATEAHFMFFALLPLAAVYAAWTPFLLAVGYVAVHHFGLGYLVPGSVFDQPGSIAGMAALHAAFILGESLACLVAWRLFEDRRELVERLVEDRTVDLREQRDALARLAAVVESTDDAVFTTTSDGVILSWNPGAERLYGYTGAEAVGEHITMIVAPERAKFFASTIKALAATSSQHVENVHVRKDGSRFAALLTISNILDERGAVTAAVGIARDISERKRIEAEAVATARKLAGQAAELSRLAWHDPLTGLANRVLMRDRLEHALAPGGARSAVLLFDLDEFKAVNDVFGHAVGDAVLVEVARRLAACVCPADTVARLGGDEFVVLLPDVEGSDGVVAVANRILAALNEPIDIADQHFLVNASIGIILSDGTLDRGPTEMLRDADIAMYAAKRAGKGRYQLFEADMYAELVAHNELIRDLRSAVAGGQLRLLYQPQVDLPSGRMSSVEALVRWQHPTRGLLTPDRFISLAESTGMIGHIDDWVLVEACRQLREWDDAGLPPLNMAVNVSAHRLVAGDLAATIETVLGETAIASERLEIELTETVAVEHDAVAVQALTRVRKLGVRVAIDDFGMGHSALSRLQTFPVDRLKIDRSFIAPLTQGAERGSLADAMIAIGRSLGLDVVAEGVETREHLRALRTLGCGSAQGYLFSKPVAAREIERLMRGHLVLAPPDEDSETLVALIVDSSSRMRERQTRNLLAELERVTGLETTYVTRIDPSQALQQITHARNTGLIEVPESLTVDWSDTICHRALERGITYTDDVPSTFPDSSAAAALGLQTYISVPLRGAGGEIEGTLCGASSRRVSLGPEAVQLMEHFADLITREVASRRHGEEQPTSVERSDGGALDEASLSLEARDVPSLLPGV
ncbi:MAG: EAL domain-containing protein [Actinomycetota bacterium]|nr:EAL domain-containing protein [Actinomycetota bacterium]